MRSHLGAVEAKQARDDYAQRLQYEHARLAARGAACEPPAALTHLELCGPRRQRHDGAHEQHGVEHLAEDAEEAYGEIREIRARLGGDQVEIAPEDGEEPNGEGGEAHGGSGPDGNAVEVRGVAEVFGQPLVRVHLRSHQNASGGIRRHQKEPEGTRRNPKEPKASERIGTNQNES